MLESSVIDLRYRELGVAIVAQACEDYCMSKRIIDSNINDIEKLNEAYELNNECIEFFNSDRFRIFSNFEMPVETLLERLDYLAENDEREFIRFFISREDSEINE